MIVLHRASQPRPAARPTCLGLQGQQLDCLIISCNFLSLTVCVYIVNNCCPVEPSLICCFFLQVVVGFLLEKMVGDISEDIDAQVRSTEQQYNNCQTFVQSRI